jgi:UDP-glucose 4-epimerase
MSIDMTSGYIKVDQGEGGDDPSVTPRVTSLTDWSTNPGKILCLVIGAAGFLGRHLVAALATAGYRVRALDLHPPSSLLMSAWPSVEHVTGNAKDITVLQHCLRGVDVLLPFASSSLPVTSNADPLADVRVNLVENVNLFLEASRAGVKRIIFPSSGGTIYGTSTNSPTSEVDLTDPISSYGIVKLASEKYLNLMYNLNGTEYIVLRYGNPYGNGQDPRKRFGAVGVFLSALAEDRPIDIWGDGTAVRDFVYIDDAIAATMRALTYSGRHRIFNVGSGVGTSLLDLIQLLERVTQRTSKIVYHPARKADVGRIVLHIGRANRELDWRPRIALQDGVERVWDTFAACPVTACNAQSETVAR